jgi:riboflavin kinase / FMN adenylyltransferase
MMQPLHLHTLRVLSEGGVKWSHPAGVTLPASLVAAIGSFDGVHLGHKAVIDAAVTQAHTLGLASAVISFAPHPQVFFRPESPPFALMDLEQKRRAFAELGVQHLILLQFDAVMASLSPADFCARILKDELHIAHIVAGFDFTFGARGLGKAGDLVQLGEEFGFSAVILAARTSEDGEKLSSSAVREALIQGDVARAAAILGRQPAIRAEIVTGAQKGRTIGFPTLNMALGDYLRPLYGVYVTRTTFADGQGHHGVSNIGKRPTVDGLTERLETHLFDFSQDVYGQTAEVELLAFLRPEMKFDSFPELKAQIDRDAEAARNWFRQAAAH